MIASREGVSDKFQNHMNFSCYQIENSSLSKGSVSDIDELTSCSKKSRMVDLNS